MNPTPFDSRDIQIADRLVAFWANCKMSATQNEQSLGISPWNWIIESQDTLINLMDSGDRKALLTYLYSAPKEAIHRGILQGDSEFALLTKSARYRELQGKVTINRFLSLVESYGGISVQNPEQGKWGITGAIDFQSLLRSLDIECGFKVKAPQVFSDLLQTTIADRKFNQVDLMALNSALNLRNLSKNSKSKTILEIGAGSGMSVYWCTRLGIGPIQIVDLPHVAIVQAFFLLKSLPEVDIFLYGEEKLGSKPAITIFPNSAFKDLKLDDVGIIFNQDSFAEMSDGTIRTYLEWLGATSDAIVYSINHESEAAFDTERSLQSNFHSIATSIEGYQLISRHPSWIRLGYVEEIWKVGSVSRL